MQHQLSGWMGKKSGGRAVVKSDFFPNCACCVMNHGYPSDMTTINIVACVYNTDLMGWNVG